VKRQARSPLGSEDSDDEEESLSDASVPDEDANEPAAKARSSRKDRRLVDPEFLKMRTDPLVQAAREHLLGEQESNISCRPYQQYDHAYIPPKRRINRVKTSMCLPEQRRNASRAMHVERMNADAAYLAPFSYPSLHYCLNGDDVTKEEAKLSKSKRRQKAFPIKVDSHESPLMYGNCLVCTPCPCDYCSGGKEDEPNDDNDESAAETTHLHSWCLLHPTGELLSTLCISNLILPHGAEKIAPSKRERRHHHKRRHELDVGETILQIAPCGDGRISNTQSDKSDNEGAFVVRSTNYCTVVRIRTHHHKKKKEASSGCSGLYRIEEVTRIDLRSLSRWFPSYKPMDVATHPRYGNAFSRPKFAILSSRNGERNTIHHVSLRDEPLIEEHNIPSLKSISLIDFTSTHPMTLWAAAESHVRPKLVTDIYTKRPLLGHGHSLYTIDLRSNDATFQWSPSAEEMMVEGVYSISGIMTDWTRDHKLWVSSLSAGKTWEIDSRMPCRVVNTFSLPFIADEGRTVLPAMGLNGGGSILAQPVLASQNQHSCPILSVDKTPGAFGLHVYQRPDFRPRFQTNSLECVACPGLSSSGAGSELSISRSSCFPLPDVSENVFTCGLASFQTRASDFLSANAIRSLGYSSDPETVLSALTMTNKGDLYSHYLLECSNEEESRSKTFPGLPLGCAALAVPASADNPPGDNVGEERAPSTMPDTRARGGWNLPLTLTNEFPLARAELAPLSVKARKECRPFTTVRLEHLPAYSMESRGTARNNQNAVERTGKQSVELAEEYTTAAHEEIGRLQDGFSHGKKSVVESHNGLSSEGRSDMTADIVQLAGNLWRGEAHMADHSATTANANNDANEAIV
jgi:hypothetical protein